MSLSSLTRDQAKKLLLLRERIEAAKIPPSKVDETLIIGTWNIRAFGKSKRSDLAIALIAEIIRQYDLIAITELTGDLGDLKRVMRWLGSYWRVVMSDFRDDGAGNDERIAYLYDSRMVRFTGLAAEANPPREKASDGIYRAVHEDWWRSPYMASFTAGDFDFVMITAHTRWGNSVAERATALGHLADWVQARRQSGKAIHTDFIVLGDFNIPSKGSSTYRALTKHSLRAAKGTLGVKGTNLSGKRPYDQIMHAPTHADRFSDKGGVIQFYDPNEAEGWKTLFPRMSKHKFTHELSDHLPLWTCIDTNISDYVLRDIAEGKNPA